MIILTSNGLSSNTLIEELKKLTIRCSNAVIITTASVGYKENDWHIPRLKSELESLNLTVDFFDFDVDTPEKLLEYDVVEINGGNPFYLLNVINNAECKEILAKIGSEKILIGISAGSLVLQNNIDLIASYSPEMNNDVGLKNFTGLCLVDVQILPHYHRFISKFESFENRAHKFEIDNNCSVIRIDDGQAVIVSDNSVEIL